MLPPGSVRPSEVVAIIRVEIVIAIGSETETGTGREKEREVGRGSLVIGAGIVIVRVVDRHLLRPER